MNCGDRQDEFTELSKAITRYRAAHSLLKEYEALQMAMRDAIGWLDVRIAGMNLDGVGADVIKPLADHAIAKQTELVKETRTAVLVLCRELDDALDE